jgi:hypothetical protein
VKDYKEGYDTFHPSDLSNEIDDLKLFYIEYRAALKRCNATKSNLIYNYVQNKSYIGISFVILVLEFMPYQNFRSNSGWCSCLEVIVWIRSMLSFRMEN